MDRWMDEWMDGWVDKRKNYDICLAFNKLEGEKESHRTARLAHEDTYTKNH